MSRRLVVADPAPTNLLYLLKQVELAVRSLLEDIAAAHGITALQYTSLSVLERHPGITAAELARNSFVRPQSMAQMLDGLEARGMVSREPDPSSRRQYLLLLTESGQSLLDAMREPVTQLEELMIEGWSPEQRAQFADLLHSGRHNLVGDYAR